MEHLGLVGLADDARHGQLFAALTGLLEPGGFEAVKGVAPLPDERVDALAVMSQSKKVVHTSFEIDYVPGLASTGGQAGKSLGARLLGALRDCDAVLTVLRGTGGSDPAADLAALEYELVLADLASVETRLDKQRRAQKGDPSLASEVAALERAEAALADGIPVHRSRLTPDERAELAPSFLLTGKAFLSVVDVDEDDITRAQERAAPLGDDAIGACIAVEAQIAGLDDDAERAELLDAYGIAESVLPRVARSAYHLLGRRTFLTTGDTESRAWSFRAGARAPECAGVIHSDLQRGFIRAEVIDWRELLAIGSWPAAKDQGRLRVEGKSYEVADGDVLEIRFNV